MLIKNTPVLAEPAPRHATRTAQKLADFALRHLDSIQCTSRRERYLDVGCGNGFITGLVAPDFREVVGIDVEETRLDEFRAYVGDKSNFRVKLMSADRMEFPSAWFSAITCFEVLEHVPDLNGTVREIIRVCKPGGIIVISVPQVWFPFENHGARIGNRPISGKIFGLPYVRPLHRKYALARIFSSADLDRLFVSEEVELLETRYASPQFERAAAREGTWESRFTFLRAVLDRGESVPVLQALTGVSMLKAYRKRLRPQQ
jgi:SAM-dependent methyltransferase